MQLLSIPTLESANVIKRSYLERQFYKMFKYTQTIRRQFADNLFEWIWPFLWDWRLKGFYSNNLSAYRCCSYLGYLRNIVTTFFILSWFQHKSFLLEVFANSTSLRIPIWSKRKAISFYHKLTHCKSIAKLCFWNHKNFIITSYLIYLFVSQRVNI